MDKFIVIFVLLLVPCSTMSQKYIINLTSAETTMNINSPNYPTNYDNDVNIEWQVIAPTDYRVMVQFNDFNLEQSDSLRVYHALTNSFDDATQRALLSGSSLPDNISSIGSYLWLRFISDGSVTERGFSLSISAVKLDWACDFKEDTCGLIINDGSWTIGEQANYYYIEADENGSSFTIPHVFNSVEGSLSFGLYQASGNNGLLSVTVCKSRDPLLFRIPFGRVVYEYIQYSCSEIQDVEVKFTESGSQFSPIRVFDIQLFEISGPSTASPSTVRMQTTPFPSTLPGPQPTDNTTRGSASPSKVSMQTAPFPSTLPGLQPTDKSTQGSASSLTIIMNTTPLQTTTPESTQSEGSSEGPRLVGTSLSLVPILSSTLASLSAIAIIVLIVCVVCRQKRLKHGSSQGIAASGEPRESPGIKDNPTFDSPNVHDLQMSDVADCHGGNDPYIALTTPHDGPTVQEYQTLGQVISQGDGYEVPINGANGRTGPEYDKSLHKFQVHPETDYEITHEYQDITNSVVGRNNVNNKSPVCGLQVQPETDFEITHEYQDVTNSVVARNNANNESPVCGLQVHPEADYGITHEYQDPGIVGANIPQYESQVQPDTDYEAIHEYEDPGIIGKSIPQYESHIIGPTT